MKHLAKMMLIALLVLTFPGCGGDEQADAPVPAAFPGREQAAPGGFVMEMAVPERDPFVPSGTKALTRRPQGGIMGEGRDPFAIVPGGVEHEKTKVKAGASGRDPFAAVANVLVVPLPEEQPAEPGEQVWDTVLPDSGKVRLEVATFDRCWLEVHVDQVLVLRTNVPAGSTLVWEGEGEVRLEQVGREWAVEVVVNGRSRGRLSTLVQRLLNGEYVDSEAGVLVTLERRYPGGVLVGLRFRPLAGNN